MFQLTREEFANLKSQFAISSWGGRRTCPFAFTEHGAIMAAAVLNSSRALEVSVYVVRAFIQLREVALSHSELSRRLNEVECRLEVLSLQHEEFKGEAGSQLKEVVRVLRELMAPTEPPKKRPIGFVTTDDSQDK
jgi:hypothetical protein